MRSGWRLGPGLTGCPAVVFLSQLTLDIIGKSVFNYDFNSLTSDSPLIQVPLLRPLPAQCLPRWQPTCPFSSARACHRPWQALAPA
jgi:hypothetical protein